MTDSRTEMKNILTRLKPWAEDLAEESCECFEFIPTGRDFGGTYGETRGQSGTCHSCIARDILSVLKKQEGKP